MRWRRKNKMAADARASVRAISPQEQASKSTPKVCMLHGDGEMT